ncbi:MAG TPA: ROK family protein [Ktedonobacterales bacterium]|nr:ROK family protein [Ktedonobacterales bacterium]
MPPTDVTPHISPVAVGIEIADSATRLSVVLAPDPSARRWQVRLPNPPTPDIALDHLGVLILRALHEHDPSAVPDGNLPALALGVAVWGRVNAQSASVRSLPQTPLGWADFPLSSALAERWHASVRVESATNAAAIAEATLGAGVGYDPLLYVSIARSVSTAVIARGEPLHGARGLEGALAHLPVRPGGPRCSCGARGHLEPIASAQAIVRTTIGRASDVDESLAAIQRITGGRAESLTAPQVVQLAAEGDPIARAVLDDALDALALALANAVALVDPGAVVLGGPLATAGAAFLSPLRARLALLIGAHAEVPSMIAGSLEPRAALVGAYLLATSASA